MDFRLSDDQLELQRAARLASLEGLRRNGWDHLAALDGDEAAEVPALIEYGADLDALLILRGHRARIVDRRELAADAAIRSARTCIQVHGGMGFTWAMITHYRLKRAWVLENAFGTRAPHSANMASTLERELVR